LSDNLLILHIEQALTGLSRLTKAQRFYPQGHPSLLLVVQETMQAFMPLLSSTNPPVIHVKQHGFFLSNSMGSFLSSKKSAKKVRHCPSWR